MLRSDLTFFVSPWKREILLKTSLGHLQISLHWVWELVKQRGRVEGAPSLELIKLYVLIIFLPRLVTFLVLSLEVEVFVVRERDEGAGRQRNVIGIAISVRQIPMIVHWRLIQGALELGKLI